MQAQRTPGAGTPDEFSPRERGMMAGHDWAERAFRIEDAGDPESVARSGEVPDALRERMLAVPELRERLDASDDPRAEEAFLAGFIHGVRACVVELRSGTGRN